MNIIFASLRPVWLCAFRSAVIASSLSVTLSAASHSFIKAYEGSKTCARCHDEAAAQIMATSHWTWTHKDPQSGQLLGKNNIINNYCIAVPSNEPRCTSCHIGLGYADKTFDFSDATKVDCLICHDTTGTYKKFPTGSGHPVYDTSKEFPAGSGIMWEPPDLLKVAQNVGKTSRATCGACHFFGGGGDAVKHGDLDSTLYNPRRELDVHMGVDGGKFSCAKCHDAGEHHVVGTSYPSEVTDNQACEKCHTAQPHGDARLNTHAAKVSCQACHIPAFARGGRATKMHWDWSVAGRKTAEGKNQIIKNADGDPTYDTQKGAFAWEANVTPDYAWFNGGVTYVTLDTPVDPAQVLPINRLHGDVNDPKARLFPVKRFTGMQPYDAGRQRLAVPHLFGQDAGAYWKSYDWAKALEAGQAYIGQPFSGEVGFVKTEMFWIQNHMVAPKEAALSCVECHAPRSRLNFAALGYASERAAALQTLAGFEIGEVRAASSTSGLRLKWSGSPGYRYQVQSSADLRAWANSPDGERTTGAAAAELVWEEASASSVSTRFFRILRTGE